MITEESWYGKHLGGGCYAGFPLNRIIRIDLSNVHLGNVHLGNVHPGNVHLELTMYMCMTKDLSYDVTFDWDFDSNSDLSFHYNYSQSTFQNNIQQMSTWTEKDWTNNSFIDITIDNNAEPEKLQLGPIHICITEENKNIIMNFLERFKESMQKLLMETEELYHTQKSYQ